MPTLGEFEHLLMLALLRHQEGASALELRETLHRLAGRETSRGALYATLDRLESKGWLEWIPGEDTPERGGIPARRAIATPAGAEVVRAHHAVLRKLSNGLGLAESD